MTILYFLIGCSVLLALIFLAAFFWAQRSGQNDDLYTPGMRILLDEEQQKKEKSDQGHI
ncbi:cbb3-type cytochrome oxidase assembly protein CcoS [Mucilaginibacter ginkgonis]|uniref:Cbb3-type cytochrome oxidase assembly protein CcoS n=1 Tax=Mucilaginibacter ginkgonis TaxID=2682091 RepID=A0A6I4HYS7_9SPHI|nr:cbb3-type cytochrome oxidase assembly protein CcoS [Mucilaginibacter ginkgonis]QQL50244.1 cbb3-type cytochrome oxidase assembly protein CcoS [Mucilaginibacter ginkgonis]